MALRSTTILAGLALAAAAALLVLVWHTRRSAALPPAPGTGQAEAAPAARSADALDAGEAGRIAAGADAGRPATPAGAGERRSRADGFDALVAEGRAREWQLPLGKGWWSDALINPQAREFDLERLPELQVRALGWIDKLRELKERRSQRLVLHARERVAAGLALEDARGAAPQDDGLEHMTLQLPVPGRGNVSYRVDVKAGDDAELDSLEHQRAEAWYSAVEDLRRWIEAQPRR